MTVPIDQLAQHAANAIPPINVTVQQPAGLPEWIKTLLSALGGLTVGLLMEFVKPALEKRRKKKSVARNLAKEVMANLRVMEACKLILEESERQPPSADLSTKVAAYIRHLMGALSVDRFDHYRKQDPVLISENDPELILNGFMQSIRTLAPMVLNQVHPQFKEILQNSIRAGHAYLANKRIRFDPNGYPLNEVQPLLEATRQQRLEKEPADEGHGGSSI